MIVLDTSILVDSLSGERRSAPALRAAIEAGQRLVIPTLVLYEWLRGPRLPREIAAQEVLFPSVASLPFASAEAAISAKLYRSVKRPRGREVDIAIAACALGLAEDRRHARQRDGLAADPPATIANVELGMRSLAGWRTGRMRGQSWLEELREWATFLLSDLNVTDLAPLESWPEGDELLGALWDASFEGQMKNASIRVATALVDE